MVQIVQYQLRICSLSKQALLFTALKITSNSQDISRILKWPTMVPSVSMGSGQYKYSLSRQTLLFTASKLNVKQQSQSYDGTHIKWVVRLDTEGEGQTLRELVNWRVGQRSKQWTEKLKVGGGMEKRIFEWTY